MSTMYKPLQKLKLQFNFAYVLAFWLGIANIQSTFTTNVSDKKNIRYLLHFSAPFVITNCV